MTELLGAKFDLVELKRSVSMLSHVGIRHDPITPESVKAWVNQFEGEQEIRLAWLLLRNLIFRTNPQLESSLRQALKSAVTHFLDVENIKNVSWRDALKKDYKDLDFYCGPPVVNSFTPPGKSGELITRMINRHYDIDKWYPKDITIFENKDRYLIVDDGTYTGEQLTGFLQSWGVDYSSGKVAIVVGLAHTVALEELRKLFPRVRIFYGELLTENNSLDFLSKKWMEDGLWFNDHKSPRDVYMDIYNRVGPFTKSGPEGFGSLGLLVAYEHGIPDDSVQLLWDRSEKWKPLIVR